MQGSDAFFRYSFVGAGIAMVATDRELNIRFWNQVAMRVFGASANQMVGTSALAIVPQTRRELAQRVLKRAIDNGESNEFEIEYRDAQGLSRELAVVVSAITDDTGVRLGALICVRDVTRRVEAVAKSHENQKMASLGQMAGKMAHHFNNILGGIVTSVDYALTSDDDADCRRVLEQTSHALGRATHLVRGLLAFAEGDGGSLVQCDLEQLLREVVRSLEEQAAQQGVELTLDWPKLLPLEVPRSQITTVLQNLMQNALEAMPEGGKLSLAVVRSDAAVLIRVCDTGCGLDPAELKRIFEPFYQAEDAQSLTLGSMARGLGLAVAFGIMQQMGGSILAQSERNKGSCFEISIPAAKCG